MLTWTFVLEGGTINANYSPEEKRIKRTVISASEFGSMAKHAQSASFRI